MFKKLLFIFISTVAFATEPNFLLPGIMQKPTIIANCDQALYEDRFSVCYNFEAKAPVLSFYELTNDDVLQPKNSRYYLHTNKLIPRQYRPSYSVYADEPLYDAGHLPATASLDISAEHAYELACVNYTAPQHESFNRGLWKDIETYERKQALVNGKVYIITGIILSEPSVLIKDIVNIPAYYFKIIYIPSTGMFEAFKAENKPYAYGLNIDNFRVNSEELIKEINIQLINF